MSSVKSRGYLLIDEVRCLPGYPSEARMRMGPVAVIECAENIPCNPCESSCRQKAIKVGKPITGLPHLDENACIGCGLCVAHCSGQAIFIVDKSQKKSRVSFAYEFLPLPAVGDTVDATNRKGDVVTQGVVLQIRNPESFCQTPVITIEIDEEYADEVRSIVRR